MPPVCLYHAPGGGLGHAVRTLALARQFRRRVGGVHQVVINTPLAAAVAPEPGIDVDAFAPQSSPDDLATRLGRHVEALRPDLFIVDTFPRGLGGELVRLLEGWSSCPRVLVARGLPEAYLQRYRLREFVTRHYDLVMTAGEPSPLCQPPQGVELPYFLVRNIAELPSPDRAVALVGASQPVVLLAASGTVDECQQWIDSARGMARRWPCDWPPLRLALPGGIAVPDDLAELTIRHFPLMECLPGVRLLVGSAGYNLVHETHATATAALFFAQARLYDDQARRVACADRSVPLLEQIRRKLDEPPPQAVAVINGATLAAHQLARLLGELRPAAP